MDPRYDELPFQDTPVIGALEQEGPCDRCPGCLTFCRYEPLPDDEAFFRLIYKMAMEIIDLEEEVVRWRQVLVKYLDERWADGLRQDMFHNLSARFSDIPIYERFMNEYCAGHDPMESEEHGKRMLRLQNGADETSIHYL